MKRFLLGIVLLAVILIYPMLISIYVTLPLFIGFAGYLVLQGIEGRGWPYIVFPMLYLINLEINLSLPLLMTLLAVLIYYFLLYPSVLFLKRCRSCVALISVLAIDLIYFGLIMIYDFIFATQSIAVNPLLLYSLAMDAIVAVLL
ncbi:hypothetical protein [Nitratifractor sp.]|uniref:hypothetical protein n=1 Tax=Nitratifractor sp. TaxID=2268144 RepID=UPI0025E99AB4|nr:hypothetical protein [Nitratifractor sp.]